MGNYQIFISYARKDQERVRKIVSDIEVHTGAVCWMDLFDIDSDSNNFVKEICTAIDKAQMVLFFVSKASQCSEWTIKEVDYARRKDKCVIPILFDDTQLDGEFLFEFGRSNLTNIDSEADRNKLYSKIIDVLGLRNSKKKALVQTEIMPKLKGLKMLGPLKKHVEGRHTLRISYKSFKAEKSSEFVFYPYLLKEYRNRWFLVGSKKNDSSVINLALDRLVSFEVAPEIPFRNNPKFDKDSFYDDVIGVTKGINSQSHELLIWANPRKTNYLITKPIHLSQKMMRRNEDGSSIFYLKVIINYELYSMLLSSGTDIRVIYPPKVVDRMRIIYQRALSIYDNNNEYFKGLCAEFRCLDDLVDLKEACDED